MPTTLTNGIQLPDKGSVDWYSSMQSNYNLIDTHLGDTDTHVTAEDKANWNSKQGSLSQAQLDAIAQVATNTDDIATLQSGKADASHTHSSSDITDIGDYATKQYVDTSISDLVDNAPAALDTLKELSTALNDDANFATTVTTALSAKANSADLATVATSGDYNDLDNLPTIPTKTSDLSNDSDFVVSSNLATVATSGDYGDLSNKPSIPTNTSDLNNDSGFVTLNDFDIPSKTSDLTNDSGFITSSDVPTGTSDLINDSNFVDTSNAAVASGITSAKVTAYDNHIADTDIHVTASDKTTWNAVTSKANDSDVVHKSGDETIIGSKRFGVVQSFTGYPSIRLYSTSDDINVSPSYPQQLDIRFTDKNNNIISYFIFQHRTDINEPFRTCWRQVKMDGTNGYYSINFNNLGVFYPENNNAIDLGGQGNRWKSVYAMNYYYGSNNVEFSTKFVTTDTDQTISGNKTWSGSNTFKQNITYERTNFYHQSASPCYMLKDTELEKGSLASTHTAYPGLWQDKNNNVLGYVRFVEYSSGRQTAEFRVSNLIKNGALDPTGTEVNCTVNLELQPSGEKSLIPERNNDINLGTSTNKWKTLNGVEPSSLGMPVAPSSTSYVDISSYITVLDSSSANTYTPPSNGYITFNVTGNLVQIFHDYGLQGKWTVQAGNANRGFIPVLGGVEVKIYINASSVDKFWFIPCQGNV